MVNVGLGTVIPAQAKTSTAAPVQLFPYKLYFLVPELCAPCEATAQLEIAAFCALFDG
jgi:hypothetical protein